MDYWTSLPGRGQGGQSFRGPTGLDPKMSLEDTCTNEEETQNDHRGT